MTVREWYKEALLGKHRSLKLLIEFLVYEKKVLKMTDGEDKIKFYLQDRFSNKMNQYLFEYDDQNLRKVESL